MKQECKSYKLSAQEAIDIVRSYQEGQDQEYEIAGVISDQDEARQFLEWLCGSEARAIREQIRAQRTDSQEEK